jgi:hypothetical protein
MQSKRLDTRSCAFAYLCTRVLNSCQMNYGKKEKEGSEPLAYFDVDTRVNL